MPDTHRERDTGGKREHLHWSQCFLMRHEGPMMTLWRDLLSDKSVLRNCRCLMNLGMHFKAVKIPVFGTPRDPTVSKQPKNWMGASKADTLCQLEYQEYGITFAVLTMASLFAFTALFQFVEFVCPEQFKALFQNVFSPRLWNANTIEQVG